MFNKENIIHFQGEILMRLSVNNLSSESINFQSFFGGSELNVASALSGLGYTTNFYSVIPNNFIGNHIKLWMENRKINTKNILYEEGNLGIYFVNGSPDDIKKNNIVYNRENTVYVNNSNKLVNKYDFKENDILHISGINSLLDLGVHNIIIEILKQAKNKNAIISFDFNYREKINSINYAKKTFLEILEYSDIVFANERDLTEILEFKAKNSYDLFQNFIKKFNLKYVAHSNRFFENNQHAYQSVIYKNNGEQAISKKEFFKIKDRIGGGDAFAAGILDGLIKNKPLDKIVDFANKIAIYKQSHIMGDNIYISPKNNDE